MNERCGLGLTKKPSNFDHRLRQTPQREGQSQRTFPEDGGLKSVKLLLNRELMTGVFMSATTDSDAMWAKRINRVCRQLEQSERSLTDLASQVNVSRSELQRQFVKRLGISPKAYAQALKLQRLSRSLPSAQSTLDALLDSGWSVSQAYHNALMALGVPPAKLRSPLSVGYWLGLSELGWILMAATEKGVCWLSFADEPHGLLEELKEHFPKASFYCDEPRLYAWFNQVRDQVLLPQSALNLPLDIQGTAFQMRVWNALKQLPLGRTLSYQGLAIKLKEPSKVRAVARACASNKIGVLIPCHRIIGQDGSLKGYRWDVKRKERLLAREGALSF